MADVCHLENNFIAIYLRWESSNFNEIWSADANFAFKVSDVKYQNFVKSKWQTAAILKIVFQIAIFRRLSD